jgi:hypothetical protein
MSQFKNKEVAAAVKSVKVFGSLFINSSSAVKMQNQRKDEKVSVEYYQQELVSLEDMSVTGTRMVSQNHNAEGTEGKWKDLSPQTVKALQTRAVNTGELPELKGYSIAKLEYNTPYEIGGKEIFKDTIVFSDEKGLEAPLTQRLQKLGIVKREVDAIKLTEETV